MIHEKTLMVRYNQGDNQALRDMYVLYKDELMGLACALLHDKTSAEDTVHDVFSKLAAGQETLKITRNLKQYLLHAVANTARQHFRTKARNAALSLDAENAPEVQAHHPPETALLFGEQQRQLAAALSTLPYEQREVVLLRHFADLRFKAIASMQNVSVNTVQGRYRYGLDKLRTLLNGKLA